MATRLEDLQALKNAGLRTMYPEHSTRIAVGMATCGLATGAEEVYEEAKSFIESTGAGITLSRTGCIGFCQMEPVVDVIIPGLPRVLYRQMNALKMREIMPLLASHRHTNRSVV